MPTDPTILDFGNFWYAEGFARKVENSQPPSAVLAAVSRINESLQGCLAK